MKKTSLLLLTLSFALISFAQEKEQKFGVKFSGFVRNDFSYNTRQVVSGRGEGLFFLAPKPIELDAEGKDINDAPNFSMLGIHSRLSGKISGPDAFGAKTSGLIEGDFFGKDASTKFTFRLRHAFMKLKWETTELLVGQYWHPTFVPECFPGTVSFGAGVPFNSFSRAPQFRFAKNFGDLKVFATAMGQGHFNGKAPAGSLTNSMVPELHVQAQYKKENFVAGAGLGYQVLRPALASDSNYIATATVNSMTAFGYAKIKTKPITFKVWGMYGQNNDNTVMMGGYAIVDKVYSADDISKGFVEHTPYNTLSAWTDIHTNGKKVQAGLFAGYSENLGAAEDIQAGSQVGRWIGMLDANGNPTANVSTMMRVAPRIMFISNKTKIGAEIEYSSVNYQKGNEEGTTIEELTGVNSKGTVTGSEAVDNIKFIIAVTYSF